MKIAVDIKKKPFFFIFGFILLLAGTIAVIAVIPNPGHSVAEIEGVQKRVSSACNVGEAIRAINADGSVTCETIPAAGGAHHDHHPVPLGLTIGGGSDWADYGDYIFGCSSWGTGACNGDVFFCSSGVKRATGYVSGDSMYFCVSN